MQQLIDNIKVDSLIHISEDFSTKIDITLFNQQYAFPRIPVVFRKAYQSWDIKDLWTPDYLASKLQGEEIIENLDSPLSLSDYFEGENINNAYYKTQQHLNNEVSLDYKIPDEIKCWYKNYKKKPKVYLSWIYVGKENTYSDLHQDIWHTSAWNYLIKGKKLWFFFPLSFNSLIDKDRNSFNVKSIMNAILNNEELNYKPMYCIQNDGDLVFSPPGYFHAVVNLDLTISLTENFINNTNYDIVLEYFKENFSDENVKSLLNIVEYNLKDLKNGKVN